MLLPLAINSERLSEPLIFQYRPVAKTKTLLLDRDGVLNRVLLRGSEVSSPRSQDEFLLSEDISALAETSIIDDWNLVIISNQPDIARGRINLDLLEYINHSIRTNIPLNASYICPHMASDGCRCRKPKTGLIERFKNDFPQVAGKMVLIGDRDSDRECAERAGVGFILRRREYNSQCANSVEHSIKSLFDLLPLLRRLFPDSG